MSATQKARSISSGGQHLEISEGSMATHANDDDAHRTEVHERSCTLLIDVSVTMGSHAVAEGYIKNGLRSCQSQMKRTLREGQKANGQI